MNAQIDAFKAELHRTKQQKRELAKQLALTSIKLDFPEPNEFVQKWHERKLDKENWITTLAWENGDDLIQDMIKSIANISQDLADSIQENGFSYEVRLPMESYKCTDYRTSVLSIDYEDWDRFYSCYQELDDKKRDKIHDIIESFEIALMAKIKQILSENNVTENDYFKFISEDDLINTLIKIKSIDGYGMTNIGRLCAYSDNFDQWDFINKYRGDLIGYHQIQNPEMLPKEMRDFTIFAITNY